MIKTLSYNVYNMFGYRVRCLCPFMPTWRMISQKDFHIACASGTHSILKQPFSNQNIISYFNPWINHILLYVVDSTNRQCTIALRYFRSCFRCAALTLKDLQSSLALWLQPSLPFSKFISISWKMTPHSTCSYNQELGSHIVIYKHMVLICWDLWTIHSEFQHILQPSIFVLSSQLNVSPISYNETNHSSLDLFWTPSKLV